MTKARIYGQAKMWIPVMLSIFVMAMYLDGNLIVGAVKKSKVQPNVMSPSIIVRTLLRDYKKIDPPSTDTATNVSLGIYINSFYSINEQTMDFSVSMYLRQTWLDFRMSFANLSSTIEKFRLAENMWNEIWVPDTFFRNEKAASFHAVTVPNRFLRLSKDGTLWYVIKVTATFACPMNLQYYPLDMQTCSIQFESFSHTSDTITYSWLEKAVDMEANLQLPQYKITEIFLENCSQNYTAGFFPCITILFNLQREIGYFLIQVYVPSILVVILSWVSFWINIEASPARVSIGLLTVLTTTTMSAGARAALPRVSYIKALDVWMIVCLVFVFTSLLEYAVVNVISRRVSGRGKRCFSGESSGVFDCKGRHGCGSRNCRRYSGRNRSGNPRDDGGDVETKIDMESGRCVEDVCPGHSRNISSVKPWKQKRKKASLKECLITQQSSNEPNTCQVLFGRIFKCLYEKAPDGKSQAVNIDKFSRRVFPVSFLIFNIIYWVIYSSNYRRAMSSSSSSSSSS